VRLFEGYVLVRQATGPTDPAYAVKQEEILKLNELKAKLEAAMAPVVPAASPSVKIFASDKPTPPSLDETATPNERLIFSKLKAHGAKLDGIFDLGKEGFDKADAEYKKAEEERQRADKERQKAEAARKQVE